jgi:hypothetical protein
MNFGDTLMAANLPDTTPRHNPRLRERVVLGIMSRGS